MVTGGDWKGMSFRRDVLGEVIQCIIDGNADCIL